MDLSRAFLPDREIVVPAEVLATLVAAQGGSETARVQAILDAAPPRADGYAPVCASFDAAVAAALWRWRGEGGRE